MIRETILAAVRLGAARAGKGFLLPVPLVGAYVIDGPGETNFSFGYQGDSDSP